MAKDQAILYILLYTSAEKWAIPALQNKIMDNLHAWTTTIWDCLPPKWTSHIYKYTPRGSPLRSYLVDSFLAESSLWEADCENGGRTARLKSRLKDGDGEFALMQLTPKEKLRAPDKKSACIYHKHEDGKNCSK